MSLLRVTPSEAEMAAFRETIKMMATPLTLEGWQERFDRSPFAGAFDIHAGAMSLMTLDGLLADEGWAGTLRILQTAMQAEETKERFYQLAAFFQERQHIFGHCTVHAVKE
jgi:hypothetical protein